MSSSSDEEEKWTLEFEFRWRLSRAEWDRKQFDEPMESPVFATVSNGLRYLWSLELYPKGEKTEKFPSADKQPNVAIYLYLEEGSIKKNVEVDYELFIAGEADAEGNERHEFRVSEGGRGYDAFCPQKKIEGVDSVVLRARIWLKPSVFDIDTLFPDPHFQDIPRNRLLYQQTVLGDQSRDCAHGIITIIVSNKDRLPCHQLFLQYSSPIFQAMFEQPWAEGHTREVHFKDASLETVKQLLFYFYVDAMPEGWKENAVGLLRAAHKYDVKKVVEMCEKELAKGLSVESAVELLPMAKKMDLELLGMRATQMLADNWDQVCPADRKKLRQSDAILEVMDASASEKNVILLDG